METTVKDGQAEPDPAMPPVLTGGYLLITGRQNRPPGRGITAELLNMVGREANAVFGGNIKLRLTLIFHYYTLNYRGVGLFFPILIR